MLNITELQRRVHGTQNADVPYPRSVQEEEISHLQLVFSS